MHLVFLIPAAELTKFQAILEGFFILLRIIIDPVAIRTLHFYQIILRHTRANEIKSVAILPKATKKRKGPPSAEPETGLEPVTYGLQNRCSTN